LLRGRGASWLRKRAAGSRWTAKRCEPDEAADGRLPGSGRADQRAKREKATKWVAAWGLTHNSAPPAAFPHANWHACYNPIGVAAKSRRHLPGKRAAATASRKTTPEASAVLSSRSDTRFARYEASMHCEHRLPSRVMRCKATSLTPANHKYP